METRQCIASDLKSFYASVECVARGLDPLTTNLLVTDESRTDKTICLAVSPSLKKIGVPSRPRLFEAKERIRMFEAYTHTKVDYIIAPPRMAEYIRVSSKVYEIYLRYDVMTQGSGDARKQPLWFLLTTAGTDRESICWEVHQKALDIIEGRKDDPRFYPVLFGLPDDADWTDEQNWYKANPSLDKTIAIDKVRDAFRKAQETPADENMFRQLRLNQWVKQSIRWMPMDKWDECGGAVNEYELEGRACYAGLDLSSTSDLTAMVLVFPPRDEEEQYIVLPHFWLPKDTLQLRVRRDHVMYDKWEKQGFLHTTEGNVVHYGFIEQYILKLGERFNIREIAYDRWNATMMVQTLEDDGFTMVPFGQGFRDMSPPTKELMRIVLERKLNHGGHPVLRWNMDNAFVRTDPAGNLKIDKEKSTEKVDGAVALVMALDRTMKNQGGESVYDTRGFLVL